MMLSGFLFDLRSMPAASASSATRCRRAITWPAADAVSRRRRLGRDPAQRRGAGRHGRRAAGGGASGHTQAAGMRRAMLEAILRILALIHKELLAILKDPRSRVSLFMPPMLQCLIFGYAATYDLNNVPYAVLDQDRSAASHDLLASLDGSGVFHRVAQLRSADGHQAGHRPARPRCLSSSDRAGFRAPLGGGPARRRASHRRRPQFQHRRHGARLCQRDRRQLQRQLGGKRTARRRRRCRSPCAPGTTPIWRRAGT